MPETFLIVVCLTVAGGAAAYLGVVAILWPTREPRTEPVSPAGTATPWRLRLPLVRWAQRRTEPAHVGATAPGGPDETDEPTRDESGADENWGAELHAMTQELRIHPGFTTDEPAPVEIEPADLAHLATIDAAIAEFRAKADAVLTRLLPSSVDDTGAIPRAELDALLEGAGA